MNKVNEKVKFLVKIGLDFGGPESGPIMRTVHEMVDASSEEDAVFQVEEQYKNNLEFCGCTAYEATKEEIEQWEKEMEELSEIPFI